MHKFALACSGLRGCAWFCAGVLGVRVRADVPGCKRVCAGVHRCAQVCTGVQGCVWVSVECAGLAIPPGD